MKSVFTFFFLSVFAFGFSQTYQPQLPANPKPGKCYKIEFNRDKKYKWEDVDCESLKNENSEKKSNISLCCDSISAYQIELKDNGLEVEVNGILDKETIDAHHKYLKIRKKRKRKLKRKA